MTSYLDPWHGDCGRSCFSYKAVWWASFNHMSGVGHVHATTGSKHKVLPQGIHEHYNHPFEQGVGEARGIRRAPCNVNKYDIFQLKEQPADEGWYMRSRWTHLSGAPRADLTACSWRREKTWQVQEKIPAGRGQCPAPQILKWTRQKQTNVLSFC